MRLNPQAGKSCADIANAFYHLGYFGNPELLGSFDKLTYCGIRTFPRLIVNYDASREDSYRRDSGRFGWHFSRAEAA